MADREVDVLVRLAPPDTGVPSAAGSAHAARCRGVSSRYRSAIPSRHTPRRALGKNEEGEEELATLLDHRLHVADGRSPIVDRFDRLGHARIGYVSALMLERADGESGSYLEIADVIIRHSPSAGDDLRELWRRMAFSGAGVRGRF